MAGFGEDFRTRGGLEISTYGAGQQMGAAISVGRRARVTVLGQWADLGKLKDLVVQAKTTLDSVKKKPGPHRAPGQSLNGDVHGR